MRIIGSNLAGLLGAALVAAAATEPMPIDIAPARPGSGEPKESEKPRKASPPVSREKLIYALGRLLDNSTSAHHARQVRDYIDQTEDRYIEEITALKNQLAEANEIIARASDEVFERELADNT